MCAQLQRYTFDNGICYSRKTFSIIKNHTLTKVLKICCSLNRWCKLGLENEWTHLKERNHHQKLCFVIKMYNILS